MLDARYQTFLVLSQTRSYTQTAHRRYITQPAVTQQIKSLEAELGVQLVSYRRPHLTITSAGTELAMFVQRVQVEADKLVTGIRTPQGRQSLTFSTTLSLSEFLAPQLIQTIQTATALRQINCQVTNTRAALAAIDQGNSDFALIEGNFDKQRYDYRVVRQEPFVGVVAATNPLAQKVTVSWRDLVSQPLLIRELGSGSREILVSLAQASNIDLADFKQLITVNNPAAIRQLLLRNVGISFVYRSVVADELATGTLRELPLTPVVHDLALVYAHNSFFADDYARWAEML
ncbi:transcriptional regulator [Levilactobacillus senmaizukei DSM 21775 = NBRC 103853]|uniref:Transcriptional regulator n=1 Tax=Levilactobacillus senmaizukei DSM 21775 = NBRC 103853 TaxID=1423803 RepID=A0A0R2DGE5_9LACO|nr:LysR family transcriptional regulator [Levilactobacillus senmaizukei]KRN02059.1 transcriptional regulator [Levilactobacillus senmaizukei DSM 21775 = NBRC 103853]